MTDTLCDASKSRRLPALLPWLAILLLFIAGCADSNGTGPPGPPPPSPPPITHPLLLVANKGDNSLSLFDPATQIELRRVPTRGGPHEVAVSPNGRRAYVTDFGVGAVPGNTITVVDLDDGTADGTIGLGTNFRPHGIEVASDGAIWVTTEGSESVLEVNPESRSIVERIPTGQTTTHMLALIESAARVYTANIESGSSTAIDSDAAAVITSVATGAGAEGIAASPDGSKVYVTNRVADTLTEIDVATNQVTRELLVGDFPIRVKIRADGSEAIVTNLLSEEVMAIDLASFTIARRLVLPGQPIGLLLSPNDQIAYVALPGEDVVVIVNLDSMSAVGGFPTRDEPDGLAWAP